MSKNQLASLKYEFLCEKVGSLYITATTLDFSKEQDVGKFKIRCADLDSIQAEVEECFLSIQSTLKEEEVLGLHKKKFVLFEEQCLEVRYILSTFANVDFRETIHKDLPAYCSSNKQNDAIKYKLPDITLPRFSGNYPDFPGFVNMFDALVHNNERLSLVQKKHYLTSCLAGEPANLIKHLSSIADNYEVARKLLFDRYDDKRLIADAHLSALLALPAVSVKNASHLRSFVNVLQENTSGLTSLGFPVKEWSLILLHIFTRKLDSELRSRFELAHQQEKIPTFENLLTFLSNYCKTLETTGVVSQLSSGKSSNSTQPIKNSKQSYASSVVSAEPTKQKSFEEQKAVFCPVCRGTHTMMRCAKFLAMDLASRQDLVKSKNLCFNCLRPHRVVNCLSRFRCQNCSRKHNTMLCSNNDRTPPISGPSSSNETQYSLDDKQVAHCTSRSDAVSLASAPLLSLSHSQDPRGTTRHSLLATAIVEVACSRNGEYHSVRALLDPGSMANFITSSSMQRLGMRYHKTDITISGVGESNRVHPKGELHMYLNNSVGDPICVEMLVLPKITAPLPTSNISSSILAKYSHLRLADPRLNEKGSIDMLLGAGACAKIFNGPKVEVGEGLPAAFETIFGWVLMGDLFGRQPDVQSLHCVTSIDETLKKFWEVEEVTKSRLADPSDVICEDHFKQTHSRTSTGRFIVRLPFRQGDHDVGQHFGDTLHIAIRRLLSLENKFKRDKILEARYKDFMREYIELGHMQPIETSIAQRFPKYFIPHHGVYKKGTEKIRCVFNASSKGPGGKSLNDELLAGPKLQQDIVDIILHFRLHEIVFSTDIRQMYRQIILHPDDRQYQLIVWRDHHQRDAHPQQGDDHIQPEIQQFQLNTLSYGITTAAFLAMRCLHELAFIGKETHPRASQILLNDIFVDDICSGSSSLAEAQSTKNELIDLLSKGEFELRKWMSNEPLLLTDLPMEHCELSFSEDADMSLKILGFKYSPKTDTFSYQVSLDSHECTKRIILSRVSSIYDPNGWLAPCVIFAKILMQRLWTLGLGWDEIPPPDIVDDWQRFCNDLHHLQNISIERQVLSNTVQYFDLHGFSDASESAYAACVFIRCVHLDNHVTVHLLISKTRVAPIKQRLTIPKLELSGAHLLARLLVRVSDCLRLRTNLQRNTCAWSDSSIVLCWLRTQPHLLQVFESNRVSQIQSLISPEHWRYVPTALNPADPASRGITPQELVNHELWWGPSWLIRDPESWPPPCQQLERKSLPGLKKPTPVVAAVTNENETPDFIQNCSSFTKLVRVTSWCLRFAYNTLKSKPSFRVTGPISGPLTSEELQRSLHALVKCVQFQSFSKDIKDLQSKKSCSTGLIRLQPFLDDNGLLRVGGRLVNSSLNYSAKHPLLLPHSQHFTNMVVDYYHVKYLHAGPSALMSLIREQFWILSARRVIRSRVFKCIRCFRLRCQPPQIKMGDLPASRVTESQRPFVSLSIDYAGPFMSKSSLLRNAKIIKSYLCVFVCFTTKSVHLEVVSDLTTEAFLAALKRFVSRRGLPREIWSDSGSNFKGACNLLVKFKRDIIKDPTLNNFYSEHFIKWRFSPPLSPAFNGLAEAAVKSSKSHLKRVIGDRPLTFEELTTIFAQIEAILNSRPLCPLSNDPNDLSVLTPGHFLVGSPLVSIPEIPPAETTRVNQLARWQLLRQMTVNVWKRWSHDYLHTLQQRAKWHKTTYDIKIGDLVLIQEDGLPSLHWSRGRVTKLFPGRDSIVRVVELMTDKGHFTRSVAKLVPLPCNVN